MEDGEVKVYFKGFAAKLKPLENLKIEYISKKILKLKNLRMKVNISLVFIICVLVL